MVAHFARKARATDMWRSLGHDLVEFSARACPLNIRPPHFASKVSYSAAPQTSAECPREAACSHVAHANL